MGSVWVLADDTSCFITVFNSVVNGCCLVCKYSYNDSQSGLFPWAMCVSILLSTFCDKGKHLVNYGLPKEYWTERHDDISSWLLAYGWMNVSSYTDLSWSVWCWVCVNTADDDTAGAWEETTEILSFAFKKERYVVVLTTKMRLRLSSVKEEGTDFFFPMKDK